MSKVFFKFNSQLHGDMANITFAPVSFHCIAAKIGKLTGLGQCVILDRVPALRKQRDVGIGVYTSQ